MIYSSEALILSRRNFGDTSIICNLFTKEYGRVSIISKGARTLKNQNRAILQPLQFIDMHYYYKPSRNIQILKEATINRYFYAIHNYYNKLIFSYNIIDLINQVCKTENPNKIIFRLVKTVLIKINSSDNNKIEIYHTFFILQLLKYLGFQLMINKCNICDSDLHHAYYHSTIGQLVCKNCHENNHFQHNISLDSMQLSTIQWLSKTHIDKLLSISPSSHSNLTQIYKYLLYYMSYHIINIKNLKSLKLMQ